MASHKDNSDYLHIGGVPIKFPWKPYASQLSMMAKIVRGIDRRQNCLLESPTGSGKSLALLCSSLGWQKHEYDKQNLAQQQEVPTKFEEDNTVLQTDPTDCSLCSCYVKDKTAAENPRLEDAGKSSDLTTISGEVPTTQVDDADVFQQDQKKIRTPGSKLVSKTKRDGTEHFNDEMSTSGKIPTAANTTTGGKLFGVNCSCVCHSLATDGKCKEAAEGEDVKFRLPKIYFGTRTHKQIAQIIRELKRTAYGGAKMAILGSREHLCVHPEVSRSHTKNDGCRELLDSKNGTSCRYYANVLKMRHHWQLEGHGLISAWDVEDLVTLGKKIKSCPYFATRNLANEADIIFCPYNYLIDPLIRSSMDIVLKDQIIILDEAHNIEDSAREAASLTIRADDLQDVIDELDKLIGYEWRKEHCQAMHTVAANLQRWITSQSGSLSQNDFNRASKVWTGVEMVAQFGLMAVSPATFDVLKHNFNALLEDPNPTIPVEQMVALSSGSVTLLRGLFIVVDYLFRENMVYMKDYKVALIKEISQQKWRESTNNRWVRVRRDNSERLTYSLNFWCMNPAVAFSDAGGEARTIILTSGTLSPMGSFASELGVAFPISLEANHVIKDSQVWVGSIATGPTGKTLNASYKNTETFNFQDDLGRLVLDVCKSIPYGILCFFSSYSLMMKLSERWKNTGLWAEISEKKIIMTEARGGMKKEFDEQLREFYATIEDFESRGILDQPLTGVLFLAVCRGKVSEGMDFADNNARAVITVGIPFPSFKDPQVELKRAYNDQNRERGLLSGTEWYEIQAYRALNQALGRCLRHRNDWGALILVDERFRRNPQRYINGLSKWVRNKVNHFLHSSDGVDSLKNFVTRQQKSSQLPDCQSTALPQSPSPSLSSESSCDSYHPPMPATPGLFNHSPLQSDRFSRPTAVMHGFPAIAVKNDKGGMEVSCPNPKETSSQFQTPSRTSASNQQLVRKSNVTVSSSQRFISLSSPSLQGSASPRVSAVKLEAVSKTPAHGSFHKYLGQSYTEVISAEHHSGVSPTVFRAAEEFEESPSFVPHCKMRQTTSETPKTLKQQSMTWYLQTLNVEPRLKKLAFSNNVDEVDGQSHPNSSNVSSEDVTRTISTGTESHAEQNANRDSVEGRVSSEEPRGGISNPHCEQNTSEKMPEEERIASEGPGGTPSPHLERITNDNAEEDRVPLEKPVGTPPPLFASEDAVDGDGQQMNPLCYEKSFTHQTLQEVSDANTKEICQTQKALRNETSVSLDENKPEIRQASSDDKDVSSLGNEDLDATLRGTDCISSPSSKISSHKRRRSEGRLRRTSRTANRKTGCDRRKEQEDTIVRNSKRSKVDHFQNAQHDTNEESLSSSAISCPYCGEVICDSGIPIPVGELTSAYLLDKFRLEPEPVQRSPPRKKRPYKNPKGSHALKVDPGVTVYAVPFKSNNHDMNAYWSEEDNCCFQPVCCPTCVNNNPSEPVGYKVVCARRTCNSVTEGEIWFHGR